jgi:hypothetical protein
MQRTLGFEITLELSIGHPVFRARPWLLESRQWRIGVEVTGTRTVLQFDNRVLYFRILNLLMRTGFIVSGVASQTWTHHTIVVEAGRDPGIRRVAIITLSIGLDVVLILAGRGRAVMAARTSTEDLRVINPHDGRPAKSIVAILADVGRVDVGGILTGSIDAVMAADTVIDDAAVIKECGNPACCPMTGITFLRRYKMIGGFSGGILTVVATGATPNDLCVIYESYRSPGRFRMTVLTLSSTWNMVDR